MAGRSSDQKLAAIITPAAKTSMESNILRLMVRKKKTNPAPSAVTNQVKPVAVKACNTGLKFFVKSMMIIQPPVKNI